MAPSAKAESTRVAAEGGCARSQFNLSLFLKLGSEGVAKDETQELTWLQRAAAKGNARAETRLGYRRMHGVGVAADEAAAVALYSKAAAKGLAQAQRNLAFCLTQQERERRQRV
jgi:TPR repeat protein